MGERMKKRTFIYNRLLVALLIALQAVAQMPKPLDPPLKDWPVAHYWMPGAKANASHGDSARVLLPSASPEDGGTTAPLSFVAMTPCRVVDTRAGQGHTGQFGPPSLVGGTAREFALTATTNNPCTIPTTALAYSLNITVVPATEIQFLSIWPTGSSYPGVSTLNAPNGGIVANAAIVPAGTSGGIEVVADKATDLIIDINGYFTSATGARTAAGAINSNGTVASGPTGLQVSHTGGSGAYTLNFAAGSFSFATFATPVITPLNLVTTVALSAVTINSDGSASFTVTFSADAAFTFIAAQNN